jgi:hypothetical protein
MKDEIKRLKHELIDDMISYMKFGSAEHENDPDYDPEFDAGYTQQDVEQCGELLDRFFQSIEHISEQEKNAAILETVKTTVLGLNQLNDACDGRLIETDQREQLCEIIILTAREAGLVSSQDDITEAWREW